MCTRIIGFNLNIFVSTGSKTTKYKKILEEEIKNQFLEYNIIEDISRNSEVNAIIYSDDSEISDFSIFPDDAVIFSIFAGVEKEAENRNGKRPKHAPRAQSAPPQAPDARTPRSRGQAKGQNVKA